MKRLLLIDGDVLVYKTAFAAEKTTDWGDGFFTLHSDAESAVLSVDAQIQTFRDQLDADEVVVALTCHETVNFRKAFFPTYKENRSGTRKPLCWGAIRKHLVEKWDAKIKPTLEADDVLGILSTMPSHGQQRIIVSIDKDFKTIPGLFYDMGHGKSGQIQEITEAEADYSFMKQTLMGDMVDNYKGCPGIGPKKADGILAACLGIGSMWNAVIKTYDAAGFGVEYALTQARCARILRYEDYDTKKKQPILWRPPQ